MTLKTVAGHSTVSQEQARPDPRRAPPEQPLRAPRVPAFDPPFQRSLEVVNVVNVVNIVNIVNILVTPEVEILLAEAAPEAFDEGPGPRAT
jgi:hypothetical protein